MLSTVFVPPRRNFRWRPGRAGIKVEAGQEEQADGQFEAARQRAAYRLFTSRPVFAYALPRASGGGFGPGARLVNPIFAALGAVFFALAAAFFAGARKRPDPAGARKQRVAAGAMLTAGIAFVAAALISRPV